MRLDDFKRAVYDAGWRDSSDAQHKGITALHRKLFPVIAELEDDLEAARYEYIEAMERSE